MAIQHGADEIDIVLNLSAYLNGQESLAYDEIKTIKQICGNKHLKVILETNILKEETRIYETSLLALEAGADFIKTSTGKDGSIANINTFYTMCTAISEFYKKTGTKAGIKAAGGITSTIEALSYYAIVHELLGKLWISKNTFRIGASRLAQNILQDLKDLISV
jgi:deoxyribose-phosphate aldolase